MAKSKQEMRAEVVAVSDDKMMGDGLWLQPGQWVTLHTADPIIYGQIEAITPAFIFLKDASWIVETGRFNEYVVDPVKTCTEAEYVGREALERPVVRVTLHQGSPGKIETR